MSNIKSFQSIGAIRPRRSVFDLSYTKKMTMDMGELIPVMCDEVVPGDRFKIGNEMVIRFQPLVAPIMHEINAYVHYFFVPNRITWNDWEEFITRGLSGDVVKTLPRFIPSAAQTVKGTLWDYFGFPTDIVPDTNHCPLSFPWFAYNLIYNEYYRDQNFINPPNLDSNTIKYRSWRKDYFTSALPWQQRGTAPALPISGITYADFTNSSQIINTACPAMTNPGNLEVSTTSHNSFLYGQSISGRDNIIGALNDNVVDFADASTFDVSDLRIAFQVQKWMERNARSGARYTEFLRSHFGVTPRDDRLQRPEYLGGSKSPVIVSEVLQTGETGTTPQGFMAGHAISVDKNFCVNYEVKEYGIIMGILSVMPEAAYQQGIDRQWLRKTTFDFYFPEFANLSEQAIEKAEIYTTAIEAQNAQIFGYQERYAEMRYKKDMVCGDMRDLFAHWHLGRQFETLPYLNQTFLECKPDKRIFAVKNVDGLIVNFANIIKAIRPLPISAEPGYIDHN